MHEEAKTERRPYVAIFGDNEKQEAAKAVWSLLSGHDLKLISVNTARELEEIAPDAVLILIVVRGVNDKNNELAQRFLRDPRVVADVVALSGEPDVHARVKILSSGYDAIFRMDFLEYGEFPDFKTVLLNKVEKGFISLENRIQQEEYARFKAALAASSDAFIVFDDHRRLFFVSEHYRKAYPLCGGRLARGMTVMEAFEMCSAEQGVTEGDLRYSILQAFWNRLEGEIEFETADSRIWHIRAKKLPGGQGYIVTTTDVTKYRSQQEELEKKSADLAKALEKEQEAGAIQKQFINMISHEFRTPLSIIDGNAQILYKRADSLDQNTIRKRCRTMRNAVSRLIAMMEGVLSSSMLRTGDLTLTPEPVDLKGLMNELCEEHADLNPDHKIICDTAGLPDQCHLDRKLITIVLGNLLSNAVKFTGKNPQIRVRGWQEKDRIIVEFQDNGIGISANEIPRIFDRYYRASTSSGIPGTDIGLNLAKHLIDLHNGKISVQSDKGKGSKFVISLPISYKEDR